MNRDQLHEHLEENTRVLSSDSLKKAFSEVDRADFMHDDYKIEAYEDYAVPIGHGQTISQPSTVAFMLELLNAQEGESILDIGSGSGYTTALLSNIVGNDGNVLGLEVVPELADMGRKNMQKYDLENAQIELSDARWSATENQMYDRILVNATADEIPKELLAKLNIGGTLVLPVGETLVKVTKVSENEVEEEEYPGFVFVPLV
jgi:protein-L-isoaspartate(D-aspartate) O-methyltransferase